MMAASAGFATPIGYQTNLMVYGPGGYRFSDYVKIGVPLDILVGIITVLLAPLAFGRSKFDALRESHFPPRLMLSRPPLVRLYYTLCSIRRTEEPAAMDVAAVSRTGSSKSDFYAGRSSTSRSLPERPGRFADAGQPLPASAGRAARRARHRSALFAPGRGARELARAGRDVVVVTGTASGKTLCYNLPILETALADPDAAGPVSVSDQGPGAGSAQGPARTVRRQRRQ